MTDMVERDLVLLRILVVEDEFLVALALEEALSIFECETVGPVGRMDEALFLARTERLDGAILDVNVHGLRTYPVAEELRARGIPFIFSTGYETLDPPFADAEKLKKPFDIKQLESVIRSAFRAP